MSQIKQKAAAIFDDRQITIEMTASLDPLSIVSFLDGWCLSESTVSSIAAKTSRPLAVRELKSSIKQHLLSLDERETNVLDVLANIIDTFERANAGPCIINLLREKMQALIPPETATEITPVSACSSTLFDDLQSTSKDSAVSSSGKGILMTGGWSDSSRQSMEVYSLLSNTSRVLDTKMTSSRHGHMSGVLRDGRVMIAGGYHGGALSSTQMLHLNPLRVTSAPSMNQPRFHASSAMLNGGFFVAGGNNGEGNILSSCELFRDGKWTEISDMKVGRYEHALVAVDPYIYAICGRGTNHEPLGSVERYSPKTDTWQEVTTTDCKRYNLAAAESNGCMYLCGGYDGRNALALCERYDPRQERWENIAHMNVARYYLSLVSTGDNLFALGGRGEDVEKVVESYDVGNDKWVMGGGLSDGRDRSSAVIVPIE